MNILGLDSAQAACSVALSRAGKAPVTRYAEGAKNHAEILLPMVGEVLDEAGCAIGDLDGLGVTIGPGTFSGVRIALAAARGLALVANLPVIGVTSLEAVAAKPLPENLQAGDGLRIASFDARRGELYIQCFDAKLSPLSQPALLPIADAVGLISGLPQGPLMGPLILSGTGAALLEDRLAGTGRQTRRTEVLFPDAATVIQLAAPRLEAQLAKGADAPLPEPLYIRAPDAKLPANRGALV